MMDSKDIKVLMIGAGRDVKGGVSTVVNQYYEAGLDQKVKLKYIATMQDGGKLKKLAVAAKSYAEFSSVVKDYDIVHVHMSHRNSFYRKKRFIDKAYECGRKIIIHMHGSEFDVFYDEECDDAKKKEIRDTFKKADAVIALSEEWKEWLSTICDESKIRVLYNAVNIPNFKRTDYTDKNVLFLGRLGKRKGTYDLLEAIPSVIEKVPDAHFYLGGDGDVEECNKVCMETGLSQKVTFLGWVKGSDKDVYLKKCSTFVLPSYHEGMPMSVLEAMSYGSVVVSTYVGGIPKVIRQHENGLLIEAGDVAGLSTAIIEAITSNNRARIGGKAIKTIDNDFNSVKNIEKLVSLYKILLRTDGDEE